MGEFNYECDGQLSIFDLMEKEYDAFNLQTYEKIKVHKEANNYIGNVDNREILLKPCGFQIKDNRKYYYMVGGKFYKIKKRK